MKTKYILQTLVILFIAFTATAQQGINYKAIISDANGDVLVNTEVTVQFTILENGTTSVYKETHNPITDANGIVIVNIGEGTPVSGDFNTIDWGSNPHFLKTEIDAGDGLTDMGTTEFNTVPYALHAKTTEDAATKVDVDLLESKVAAMEEMLLDAGLYNLIDDRDGNKYKAVKIGNQLWMAENLKYLPSVVGHGTGSRTDPYYYVYDYDGIVVADAKATANYTTYGVLYNWPAAMNGALSSNSNPSGIQGVCPAGWHLPSDAEWTELTDYLGGESVAGSKLKETGEIHWLSPNTGATNETGFTALPGGYRNPFFYFANIGRSGHWWSSAVYNTYDAWRWYLDSYLTGFYQDYHDKESSYSVRCVRD